MATGLVVAASAAAGGAGTLTHVVVTATPFPAGDEQVIIVETDIAGETTVNLPPAAPGLFYYVKKLGANGVNVIVEGDGAETIDGDLNATITKRWESITLVTDGSNWFIV